MAARTMITTQELAVWSQNDPADVAADTYALMVIDLVSSLCAETAGRPEWLDDTKPPASQRAKIIALVVARRAYLNPDQEVAQAVAGGPSVRMLDAAALSIALTDEEVALLQELGAAEDPNPVTGSPDLWVQPFGRGPVELPVFVTDQSGTDWMIPWMDPRRDPWYFPTVEDQP